MQKYPNLTLKRVIRRHREIEKRYPQDKKLHEVIENGRGEGAFRIYSESSSLAPLLGYF